MKSEIYAEPFRPQFHFTAQKNWLNDPNGLVYYQGEYHLFYQYNAKGLKWGPNSWGHAVSTDLIHWKQLPDALDPDEFGWMWSGSAVVDGDNTSGLQTGSEKVLVALYTAGDTFTNPKKNCVQALAFSNDRGRTWVKYPGNPVLDTLTPENRDPKIVWHAPTRSWIMALYLDRDLFALFKSPDLIHWSHLQDLKMPGTNECPDFFELPVADQPGVSKWVFWGGEGRYLIGAFDGNEFVPESDVLRAEFGSNGYAAQSWSDIPAADGRRIQISWMRGGKYPFMPFNQQMSFPVELTLETFPEGIRLCRRPIKEVDLLREKVSIWKDVTIEPSIKSSGGPTGAWFFTPEVESDCLAIQLAIKPGAAEVLGLNIHGIDIGYRPLKGILTCLGTEISVPLSSEMLELEILVDRTSLEIFAAKGSIVASFCFIAEAADNILDFYAVGAEAKIVSLTIHPLRSAWQ